MATFTDKRLGQAQIASGSQTTLLTVGAGENVKVKCIIVVNTTATDRTVELWDVKNGASPTDANKVLPDLTVPANDIVHIWTFIVMDTAGDTLQAEASAASAITIHVHGQVET
jgi:hypothetical protein